MIINKKRVLGLSSLSFLNEDQIIRLGISDVGRFDKKLTKIGFTNDLAPGEMVLPNIKLGPVSRRNAEGKYTIHRDQPMETAYRTIEWTWKQWAGRGETEEVSDFCDVPYKRYPRTFVPPSSIELTIALNNKGDKCIVTPPYKYNETNKGILIQAINLILELFGECQIMDEKLKSIVIEPKVIRLNWEVLPPGRPSTSEA